MDMKKTAKKIAALVAGTTMLGATIMGATALDLSNYPAPFVTNGVFSGKIVVGAKAATSDVVGAIDLAASLQAKSTTTTEVKVPGAAGLASVNGDSAEFKTGSNIIRLGEAIGTVKGTFTQDDLKALKSGVLSTGSTNTPVNQYLKFDTTTMYPQFLENDDNAVADYLFVPDGSDVFQYRMEFTEGATSERTDSSLKDYEGEVISILGSPFTIVQATTPLGSGTDSLYLSMLGGQVADVLRDGETKTYTINGKDYEVTAVFISSDTPPQAKLSVNGVMTKELAAGKTQVLGADVTVGIQSILTNQREGIVEFYLGANKVEFTDDNYDNAVADGSVKVNGKSISDGSVIIQASNDSTTNVKMNQIKYTLTTDKDLYVPAGKGVKSLLTKPEGMLTDNWDIVYAGLMNTGDSTVKFNSQSNYAYKLSFENNNGAMFNFPVITNRDGTFRWGDDRDHFVFTEFASGAGSPNADVNTFISDNDYFAVSDKPAGNDKAVSHILRYSSISTGDSTVTFQDNAGNDIVESYTGTPGTTATGTLIVDGQDHTFYVGADNADKTEKYALSVDLDGNSAITNQTTAQLVTKGGGILDLSTQKFDVTNGHLLDLGLSENFTLTTLASKFDESTNTGASAGNHDVVSNISVTAVGAGSSATIDITGTPFGAPMLTQQNNNDYTDGYTTYGAKFELYNPASSNKAGELTISYPLVQRGAQVFVTAGTVDVKEGSASTGGALTTTTVNPIAVGVSVLDTDAPALGSQNLLVVGGPCVNTVAAALMGNPADCAAGFTPGKALIKLFADKNALLVAGYGAQDTLGATYVLANSQDYKLSGSEVEVVVADLNTITVNPIS